MGGPVKPICAAFAAALLSCWSASAARFSRGSIIALRISSGAFDFSPSQGAAVYLDGYTPLSIKLQTISAPAFCTIDPSAQEGYLYDGHLAPSTDSQLVSFLCFNASIGAAVTSAARRIFSVGVSGDFSPAVLTGLSGMAAFTAVQVANNAASGYYHGGSDGLFYTATGGGSSTLLSVYDATSVAIWANSLCELCHATGRLQRGDIVLSRPFSMHRLLVGQLRHWCLPSW